MAATKRIAITATVAVAVATALWLINGGARETSTTPSVHDNSEVSADPDVAGSPGQRATEAKKAPRPQKGQEPLTMNPVAPTDDKLTAEFRQIAIERFERFGKSVRAEQMQAVLGVIYDLQLERDALDQDQDAVMQAAIEDPRNPRPIPHTTWAEEARAFADTQISGILSPAQYDEYKQRIAPLIPTIIRLRLVSTAPPNPQGA